jgi:Mlc titration factor MtfA (ptsG expression regulator)
VSEFDDLLSGEAQHGGPVVLSWDDAAPEGFIPGAGNLIIHEFAHKLDMAEGDADGCPPMPASQRSLWRQTLLQAFQDFNDMVDRIEAAIPANVDPETPEADPWYALLPLDPYAASDSAEFFAVSTEKFFVDPVALQAEFGHLFIQYKRYFGIDPLKWHC